MHRFLKVVLAGLICAASARAEVDAKIVRTWKAKCASCHGVDGKGETETGKKAKLSDFTKAEWQKSKTDAQIKTAIENGAKKDGAEMDPYKEKLAGAQIDGLVQYIRTLK
jgi:mono/diheme cytochrome c family protein